MSKQVDGSHNPQQGASYAAKARTAPANSCTPDAPKSPKSVGWKLNGVPAIRHS